jgi:ATP-dependent RNA helicase SUPV3L1/SUV3
VLGYRQCGERAVRVDILERLADLIRPALSWRETSLGEKPAGAFDGRGFVVTQAMTSLTGSAGEGFASVLRALGYRMERRPAPPPKPAVIEAPAVETAPTDAAASGISSPEAVSPEGAPADTVAPEPVVAAEAGDIADIANDMPQASEAIVAPSATLLPEVAFSSVASESGPAPADTNSTEVLPEAVPSIAAEAADAPQDQPAAEATAETAAVGDADAAPVDAVDAAVAAPDAVVAAPDTVAAPELVEVWRPGGRSEERRPRHDRNRHRHQDRALEGAAPVAAAGEAGEAGDVAKRERHRRGRRDRNNDFRKPRTDAPAEAATAAADGAPVREPREDKGRPPRERFEGKGRDKGKFQGGREKGGREKGGRDKRPDSGPSHRQFATSAPPRERERPIDPNSPFAKLAALKEQLTANRKDR